MSGGRLSWKARERGPARQGPAAQPPRRSRGGQPRAPSGKKTCQKHRNRTVVWRGSTPLNSGRQKGGRRKGKKERDVQSPPSPRAAHLDEAPLGTAPPPCRSVSSSLSKSQLLSAREAGSVSRPAAAAGRWASAKLPGPWGIRTGEFSRLGPWKRRTSNNPSVAGAGFRFPQHSASCPCPPGGPPPCPLVFQLLIPRLDSGEGEGDDLGKA